MSFVSKFRTAVAVIFLGKKTSPYHGNS